jgi:hypothetical protein
LIKRPSSVTFEHRFTVTPRRGVMTNRVITPQDIENARRFRSIWEAKKGALGLTQVNVAARMGYNSQSMISQLLSAKVALSTDAILGLSKILQVLPTEINPDLKALNVSVSEKMKTLKVHVVACLSGKRPAPLATVEITTAMTRQVYGVSVDSAEYEPFYKRGSYLIVSQEEEPVPGDEVFLKYEGVVMARRFIASSAGTTTVQDLNTGLQRVLDTASIEVFDPIVSVERPMVNRPIRLHPRSA